LLFFALVLKEFKEFKDFKDEWDNCCIALSHAALDTFGHTKTTKQ